jgi:hypothetical protein
MKEPVHPKFQRFCLDLSHGSDCGLPGAGRPQQSEWEQVSCRAPLSRGGSSGCSSLADHNLRLRWWRDPGSSRSMKAGIGFASPEFLLSEMCEELLAEPCSAGQRLRLPSFRASGGGLSSRGRWNSTKSLCNPYMPLLAHFPCLLRVSGLKFA